jgi:hypothetical protein
MGTWDVLSPLLLLLLLLLPPLSLLLLTALVLLLSPLENSKDDDADATLAEPPVDEDAADCRLGADAPCTTPRLDWLRKLEPAHHSTPAMT